MKMELFPFQRNAVADLRSKVAEAVGAYRRTHTPQVVSLQAPTGSGKTIIMAALVEEIFSGNERYAEQPGAIFIWLSDSPALNEQSRMKFELKADKIRLSRLVTIEDASFDMEMLEDGHIYFLNTQKLGNAGNLGKKSDARQFTIWETLENTAREKADRLYFIIDEAHRGMHGKEAGVATSIMQRFLKGSRTHRLSSMPVVIGVSATAARFNALVGDTTSTLQKCIVSANDVRASGLLKDRIVITYPDNPEKYNEMAVLQAATDEWKDKCKHWYQYSYEQHYAQVNPVFIIQVLAGSGSMVSNTDLNDVLAKIEERMGSRFKEHEVVHTFGSTSALTINGLQVHHIEPPSIADDRRIRVVLFKENLSTGWDCPRAETMMSFRKAEDATYIAQLLGRMVRTPLQCHIEVDDSLNDVRLFLPCFNRGTVESIVTELQNTEGGEIPVVVDGESMEQPKYVSWSAHPRKRAVNTPPQGMESFLSGNEGSGDLHNEQTDTSPADHPPQAVPTPLQPLPPVGTREKSGGEVETDTSVQLAFSGGPIDRDAVIKFINEKGLITFVVRSAKVNSYLRSLLSLASLLTQSGIYPAAGGEIKQEVVKRIRAYVENLKRNGRYAELARKVSLMELSVSVFDAFGESVSSLLARDYYTSSESDLDRQLREAERQLCGYGFTNEYGRKYADADAPNAFKIDCILFVLDDESMGRLNEYAKDAFHKLDDEYRKYIVSKSEHWKKEYSDVIANGDAVSKHNFSLPETISVKVDNDGKEYTNHLLVDDNGVARIRLNGWEEAVLKEEFDRADFVCWLRNPPREKWALCIPYEMGVETRAMYPDFLIIRSDPKLDYMVDIIEPHSPDFADNLAKAKGLARYAGMEPRIGRIQLIRAAMDANGNTRFKRLDLAKGAVREKVLSATTNDELNHIFETDGFFS